MHRDHKASVVATAASVIWERCVAPEAVGRHREETRQLMFSFESKKSPSTLTSMHMMMDQLSAQGVGALNTSLPREAELRPLGRNRDFFFKKAQIISNC